MPESGAGVRPSFPDVAALILATNLSIARSAKMPSLRGAQATKQSSFPADGLLRFARNDGYALCRLRIFPGQLRRDVRIRAGRLLLRLVVHLQASLAGP